MAFIERKLGTALRRKVEAEDIFQEASVEAVRALAGTDLSQREPFSWLCQIAEHRTIDAHRHFFGAQKRDAARERPLGPTGDNSAQGGLIQMLVNSLTTPSQAFSRNVRETRLMEALAQLPEDHQEALKQRYVEGLPSKQIAANLDKSDAAVRVMLTRAIRKLQTILGDDS